MPAEEKQRPDLAAKIKDWTSAIRDAFIGIVLVLLLFFPSCVNRQLEEAGFTQADIAGFHWEKQLMEMTQHTDEAQQQVEMVEQSIDSVRQALASISKDVESPVVQAKVEQLTLRLDTSLQTVRSADNDLKSSLRTQQDLLERIPRTSLRRRESVLDEEAITK